jgi:hypothetical protein
MDSVMALARTYATAYASRDDGASNMAYAALKTAMSETENEIVRLRSALTELTAIVRGECGSLLDEDRGGSASLSMEIDDLLGPNVLADRREPIGEASSPKGDGRAAG